MKTLEDVMMDAAKELREAVEAAGPLKLTCDAKLGPDPKWDKVGGYHEEWRFVDGWGRVSGSVKGSTFQESSGWHATADVFGVIVRLGRFVTRQEGQAAVERYWKADPIEKA